MVVYWYLFEIENIVELKIDLPIHMLATSVHAYNRSYSHSLLMCYSSARHCP